MTASVAGSFQHAVLDGPLALAAVVAAVAGLVSFLSPCVLPLVPGYLSYVTGLSGTVSGGGGTATRTRPVARTLAGALLFVVGFSVVFVSTGAAFGGLGRSLQAHQRVIEQVLGVVTVVLGLAFLGVLGSLQREFRVHRLPAAGLLGAPVLGFLFALGWTPCVGPTLGAVESLALTSASADRGALLAAAYCLGLGIPFVLAAFGFKWLVGTFAAVRRHSQWVTRFGGLLLITIGVLVFLGDWDPLMGQLRSYLGGTSAGVQL